ncbi:hypothetical protein M9H77_12854 [Catharanthus roseus]|uniref:Uncharacterized protein n=1 Tax=Catharanthus roseus TaxID=4058 RepID=A0ACC0BIL0_CATRO|nr:hypothetical protein M9H77_12854 [Catharanthus roseus]
MVSYIEEALKNKLEEFEGLGKASKFSICSISKNYSRKQIGACNQGFNGYGIQFTIKRGSILGGLEGKLAMKLHELGKMAEKRNKRFKESISRPKRLQFHDHTISERPKRRGFHLNVLVDPLKKDV